MNAEIAYLHYRRDGANDHPPGVPAAIIRLSGERMPVAGDLAVLKGSGCAVGRMQMVEDASPQGLKPTSILQLLRHD
jgi:hypothetical protein